MTSPLACRWPKGVVAVGFAEDAVRDGRSVTSREALELGVVDLVADDLDDLLAQIDGREIPSLGVRLDTVAAIVERKEPGLFQQVLGQLADPNIAFILLSVGTLAIIYEAANPGLGFSGIAGVISREDAVPGGRIFGYAV
ncbi:MAG: hypothetical protein ABR609_01295 [Acidimicrobiia bacterium]